MRSALSVLKRGPLRQLPSWLAVAAIVFCLGFRHTAHAGADAGDAAARLDDRPAASAEEEQTARALFDGAMQRISGASQATAVAELVALADRFPKTTLAPEALFAAAQQKDESLGAPDQALVLYQRVVVEYPDSRLIRRAQARVAELSASLQSGAAVLTQFQHIVRSTTSESPERSARLDQLLREQPTFVLAPEALYLLLDGAIRRGDAQAPQRLKQLADRFPASEWTARGKKTYADQLLQKGQLGQARAMFLSLSDHPAPLWQKAAAEGISAVSQAETRRLLATLCGLTWAASLLWLAVRHRQRLWPPPVEVLYYVPVGLFFVLTAALLQNGVFVRPLLVLVVGGGVLCWLSAAAARAGRARRLAFGLAWRAVLAALLCYLAIERQGLWELVLETLRNGPEG